MDAVDLRPAVDIAFNDGKIAHYQDKPKQPPHSPETEQYRRWMEGYQYGESVTLSRLKKMGTPPEQIGTVEPTHVVETDSEDGSDVRPRFLQDQSQEETAG